MPKIPRSVLISAIVVALSGVVLVVLTGDPLPFGLSKARPAEDESMTWYPDGILGPHAGERKRSAGAARLEGRGGANSEDEGGPSWEPPDVKAADWVRVGGWEASLRALDATREAAPDRRLLDLWNQAISRATRPVTRQNLVFQAALFLPVDESVPWLRSLARRRGLDADDAWTALAFLGDDEGYAHFTLRSQQPEPLDADATSASYYTHEKWGSTNDAAARRRLRPYRAIEVLIRRPYFGDTAGQEHVRWTKGSPLTPDVLRDLLSQWLQRYEHHPGSDDAALYVARSYVAAGDYREAARWYARAGGTGDGDAADEAMRALLAMIELFLQPEDLPRLFDGVPGAERHAGLLAYVYVRRTAAQGDLHQALRDVRDRADEAPDGVFGRAWDQAWRSEHPRGLRSGLAPLPVDDPLRRTVAPTVTELDEHLPAWRSASRRFRGSVHCFWRGHAGSVVPRVLPDVTAFARQIRLWETLAELRRRAHRAGAADRADLLYKIAAVHHHDPEAFSPAYANRRDWFRDLLGVRVVASRCPDEAAWTRAYQAFTEEAQGELRAVAIFDQIEREHPEYRALDRVAFSRGQAWRRLVGNVDLDPWQRERAIRAIFASFETFLRDYPDSPLVEAAERALAFWRKMQPTLR